MLGRPWKKKTGLSGLEKNAKGREQEKITFDDMVRQPRFIISSVTSTGKNDKNRRYSPFTTSTEDKVPFRTRNRSSILLLRP